MEDDVTAVFDHYRISARSVWNTAFFPDPYFRTGEFLGEFQSIETILFDSLVLAKLDLEFPVGDLFRKPIPFFRISPQGYGAPIMIQCPRQGDSAGYWDDPVKSVFSGKVGMHFLSLFDWDQMSYRDLQYYRVLIAGFDEQPHLVGREALIDRNCVKVLLSREHIDAE
jgi:hypothetical protein